MKRIGGFAIALFISVSPPSAKAIQLTWASGATNVQVEASTRCTLVVRASGTEGRLPKDWRLVLVADTTGIELIPIAGPDSCGLGVAHLATLVQPTGELESLAHQVTASFCSAGSGLAQAARYVIEVPAGTHARFKVAALHPTEAAPGVVVQTREVTVNGGLASPLPPSILRVESTHQSTRYEIRVLGAGLGSVEEAKLEAADRSWEAPLTLSSLSETELAATASLAAWVPECRLVLTTSTNRMATESVAADPPPPTLDPEAACQARFIEDIYPPAVIQPKDFAFVSGGWSPLGPWTFHFFYIRQNQLTRNNPAFGPGFTEKNLGHAVSNDLVTWTVLDTAAIKVRPGRWDSQHVWAPTIIRKGVTYYMFYTGVDATGRQRIGIATSTDLIIWAQGDSVLTGGPGGNAGSWVNLGSNDLRDPFVMEDPDDPGHWLMYFTSRTNEPGFTGMVAGFRKATAVTFAPGTLLPGGALWATQQNRQSGLESPHVFHRAGRWWLFFTKPIAT